MRSVSRGLLAMATLLGWTGLSATSGQFDRRQTPFGGGRVTNAVLIASAAGFRSNCLIAVAVAAPKPGNGISWMRATVFSATSALPLTLLDGPGETSRSRCDK